MRNNINPAYSNKDSLSKFFIENEFKSTGFKRAISKGRYKYSYKKIHLYMNYKFEMIKAGKTIRLTIQIDESFWRKSIYSFVISW